MDKKNKAIYSVINILTENISRVKFGEVSVCLKVHAGRVRSVIHSITENNLEIIPEINSIEEADHVN